MGEPGHFLGRLPSRSHRPCGTSASSGGRGGDGIRGCGHVTETAREEGTQTATAGGIKAISHKPKARWATVPMPFHRRVEPQAAMVPPRRLNVRRRAILRPTTTGKRNSVKKCCERPRRLGTTLWFVCFAAHFRRESGNPLAEEQNNLLHLRPTFSEVVMRSEADF